MKKLLTVEDRFDIRQRGLIVVPGPASSDFAEPCSLDVELRRPDGTRLRARLQLQLVFQTPSLPQAERRYSAILDAVVKDDVPIGTEIWFGD